MKNHKKLAPSCGANYLKPKLIIRKFDENVKYQYEIIDILERAEEVGKNELLCMIQEAKEEIGKAYIVERLEAILEKRFGYV